MALTHSQAPTSRLVSPNQRHRSVNPHSALRIPRFFCNSLISRISKFSFIASRAVLRATLTLPSLIPFLGLKIQSLPVAFIPHSALRIPRFFRKSLISRFYQNFSACTVSTLWLGVSSGPPPLETEHL